jgi:diacylglycerol kinase (ATP)
MRVAHLTDRRRSARGHHLRVTHPAAARLASAHPARFILLTNPLARGARREAIARIVERFRLDARAVREIGRDGSARALAAEAVRAKAPYVLVAGGDGTLHEIVQVLAGTRTAVGVIPLGTSNDLAARLAIPAQLDAACELLSKPQVVAVDLLRIGDRRVATVGGFGVPAYVARDCNELRARSPLREITAPLGGALYPLASAARIIARGATSVTYALVDAHGTPVEHRASAILLGLVDRFGGGFQLAPAGEPRAGSFSALVVHAKTRAAFLDTIIRLRSGRLDGPHVSVYTGLTHLDVLSSSFVGAFGDGEWLGLISRARVTLEPAAFRVLVPPAIAVRARGRVGLREAI